MNTLRTIRLVTLGAALLAGSGAAVAAQPPARTPQQGDVARHRAAERVARARRAQRAEQGERAQAARQQLRRALFRDIELSVAQRRQVRDIGFRYADQREDLALSLRRQAGLGEGQRPDSATRARLRTELQTQHRALMERQLADLRGVLTAEQRATFDRNVTSFKERSAARTERERAGAVGGARRERALRPMGLRRGALRPGALRPGALRAGALRPGALRAGALRARMLRGELLRERALRERALRERAFRRGVE